MAVDIKGMGRYMKIGVIGGTGFYKLSGDKICVDTCYGTVTTFYFTKHKKEIFFIPRHDSTHTPAHAVNYYGNIQAFHNIGVEAIISINNVGSMKEHISVGSLFIPNDFIDFTSRKATFFDSEAVHIDMTEPFCPVIRKFLLDAIPKNCTVYEGVYVVTNGPRLETKSEINMFKQFADVVGMTVSPEVSLARECNICYASLCLVSNYAAGMQNTLEVDDILSISEKQRDIILDTVDTCIKTLPQRRDCYCKDAVAKGKL
jgi:5'-methylthioadenosine phosphorylase